MTLAVLFFIGSLFAILLVLGHALHKLGVFDRDAP